MSIYTYAEANKNLSKLLDEARENNEVIIKRENGELFAIRVISKKGLSYNLPDIDLGLTRDEIVICIREVRERTT